MQADAPQVVAIEQEPRHRPVFREGNVRILDVQIPPGDVTLYHTHDTAILYVPIALSPTDTQILGQNWLGVKPGDRSRFEGLTVATDTSYATRPVTHRVKNVGDAPFRLIAITNSANPETVPSSAPPGRTVHTSNWYNATELELSPGTTSGWQTPAAPIVVVQPGAGRTRVQVGNESTELDAPGTWAFVPKGARFRIGAEGGPSKVVVVQANQ